MGSQLQLLEFRIASMQVQIIHAWMQVKATNSDQKHHQGS